MAIKHIINGIEFTDIKTSNKSFVPILNGEIYQYDTNSLNEDFSDNGGKLPTIVNAVEIDWNGAQLSLPEELNLGTNITINTTGQLFATI